MEIRKTFHAVFITIIFILASFQAAYAIGEDFTYDANGNMIQGPGGLYYEYNDANQLKRVRDGGPTGEVIAEYWYDHTGKRIKKNESGVITYYITDSFEQIVYPNGTVVNITYYIANGERLAKKVSATSGDKLYYFHPDHLGSTSIVSDESGNLVEKTEYYPYGGVKQGGSEQYLFTGKELDKSTGLYDYGARQYNPDLARFVQPDSIVQDPYDPQNLNRYAYVRDNPLKYVDPTGHYFLTTGIDIASLAISVQDIRQDPANKWNWIALTADVATLALPVVAGGGMAVRAVKGGEKATTLEKNVQAGKAAESKTSEWLAKKYGAENVHKQVVLESGKRTDLAIGAYRTKAGTFFEVKNIDWSAKSYQKPGYVNNRLWLIEKQLRTYKKSERVEDLTLVITRPDNPETVKKIRRMAEGAGAEVKWLEDIK